jgi:predicted esterase
MTGTYREHHLTVSRTARIGVIGVIEAATTDVWIVLHGYGQLAVTFAASAEWPVAPHRAFVFPEALQRFYDVAPGASHADAPVGATWMTREARTEDIADNHAYLDAVTRDIATRAPQAQFTVFGFSQGAATAARWTEQRARSGTPPARLVIWGSAFPPDVDLGPDAPLRKVPVQIVVGTRDRWITPEREAGERGRRAQAGFEAAEYKYEGGHRLDNAMLRVIAG